MTYVPSALPDRLTVNGIDIEIATLGQGQPILYLHGGDGANLSAPYIEKLAEHYQVILPSHPGFGDSELPREFSTVADLAFFYLDFIDRLGLDNLVVVGSSFGGWLASEIATMSTEKIAALVLADPVGIKVSGREERDIADLFSIHPSDLPDYLFFRGRIEPDYESLPDDIVRRIARNRQTFALVAWSPTLYNPKLLSRLHRIKVPTLVMWGGEDRVVNRDYGAAFADAIEGARFEVIPKAGHYLAYDQPEVFVERVQKFHESIGEHI